MADEIRELCKTFLTFADFANIGAFFVVNSFMLFQGRVLCKCLIAFRADEGSLFVKFFMFLKGLLRNECLCASLEVASKVHFYY